MLTRPNGPASIGSRDAGLEWRMRPAYPLALVFLLSLGPSGCATVPKASPSIPVRPARAASLDEVLAAYDGYCNGIETLSATGDLDVADLKTGRTQRLSVRLVVARGGRLYLKGSVAIVTALEVVSDGERFWFEVPSKKTVWTGRAGSARPREEGETAPYYALRPHDLVDAFLPQPLAPKAGMALFLEGDRDAFSLSEGALQNGRGVVSRRVWLGRESLEPQRFQRYDEKGDLVVEVRLGAWSEGAPRTVEIFRPAEGYRATFRLSKVEKNVTVPERAFLPRTPEGYAVKQVPD
jgi:outer membrane lipoprotein-sorting protein